MDFLKLNETDTSLYFLTLERVAVSLPTKCLGNPTSGSASGGDFPVSLSINGTPTVNTHKRMYVCLIAHLSLVVLQSPLSLARDGNSDHHVELCYSYLHA